jgi:hypothetical protein
MRYLAALYTLLALLAAAAPSNRTLLLDMPDSKDPVKIVRVTEVAKARQNIPVVGSATNIVGRRPEEALYSAVLGHNLKPDTAVAPFELEPGQAFTMALESPDDYPTLKSSIEEKEPISNVAACNGGISQVFFGDGTQWQSHHYLLSTRRSRTPWTLDQNVIRGVDKAPLNPTQA